MLLKGGGVNLGIGHHVSILRDKGYAQVAVLRGFLHEPLCVIYIFQCASLSLRRGREVRILPVYHLFVDGAQGEHGETSSEHQGDNYVDDDEATLPALCG